MGPRDREFAFQAGCLLFGVIVILAAILILHGIFIAAMALLPIVLFLFWLAMLVDCLRNEPNTGSGKILWTLIILILNIPGAFLYFFLERPNLRNNRPF
jgi:hypothetical protein